MIKKLLFLLSGREQKQAGILLIMITTTALFDVTGVVSILPFMTVLADPSIIETNIVLNKMFQISIKFGFETIQEFIVLLGIVVFSILIISLFLKALTTYAINRFINMREYSLGKSLVERYLHQPFSWFLKHNSADLGKTILGEVSQIVSCGIQPSMLIISNTMLSVGIILTLIIIDPKIALTVGFTFSFIYFIIFYFVRKYLNKIGLERLKSNQVRYTTLSEAFTGAKEVKVGGLEKIFTKKFSNAAQIYASTFTSSQIVAQMPRFILEAVAFGGIFLIILYKVSNSFNFISAVPIISLYIFAGYRLLPALQQIYSSMTLLNFAGPSIDRIYSDFKNLKVLNKNLDQETFEFNKSITLDNISFSYSNTSKKTLKNINLTIPKKSIIGMTGPTGCGKTTIIDIILGLLQPQKGSLKVDEKIITQENARSWQRLIGYVPQQIFLSDDTIMANIALGLKPKDINYEMLEKVSKIAQIHEFIINKLPDQYQTTVGERGIRLSGGQRQRIGIARALYHNPKILILDEATSALDNETEKMVMQEISNLSNDMTIIMIAHRLNTLTICNSVFKFKKDQIIQETNHNI